jgi:pimeloyl-ACP methyl ester carboxylesterase
VEGMGGEEEIVAALEAPSLDEVTGDVGRGYRKFAEQTQSDRQALAACIIGQRKSIAPAQLAMIRAPTIVAVGEKDKVAGSAEALAAIIPGAEAFIVRNRDHMLSTGDKTFKARVLAFLGEHGLS